MLAPIALPLCLAFIYYAFWRDHKESRQLSPFLWIPTIWLVISSSKALVYWLYPSRHFIEPTDGSGYVSGAGQLDRNFFIVLITIGLLVLYKRRNRFAFVFKDNIFIYIFYLYALLSVGWSDYSGISLKRWIKFAGDLIMVLVILTEKDQVEAITRVLRRCAIFLIPLSVYFIKYFTLIGVYYNRAGSAFSWRGVSDNKNGLGQLCAFYGLVLAWRVFKEWPKFKGTFIDAVVLLLGLYLLKGSRSSTSLVVFLLGVTILLLKAKYRENLRKFNRIVAITILVVLAVQILAMSIANESLVSVFFSLTGRDSSFTGRVPLWTVLLGMGSRNPLHGFGYGSFWLGERARSLWDMFDWGPMNGHNGYLDVFLDLGLIGLMLLVLMILTTYQALKKRNALYGSVNNILLAFWIMVVFHNFTESTFAKGTSFLWFLFLLASSTVMPRGADNVPDVLWRASGQGRKGE